MNSFSGVVRALEVEFARQCELLDRGGRIEQQTMLWDANRGEVRPSRTKEGSHDYRYFPEPDLPPLLLGTSFIDRMREGLPELPAARKARFATEYALGAYDVDLLTSVPALSDYFEGVARQSGDAKAAANWVVNSVLASLKAEGVELEAFRVRPADLASLIRMVNDGIIAHSAAKQIFGEMVRTGDRPEQVAQRDGLLKVDDDAALRGWIDEVLAEHPVEAARYLGGEKKLQGVLVGFVMKKSKGSADAKKVNQLLAQRVGA
jgi:aspartyl-tRNA(Asn)/glutamyl-tRNA(Gln) amidotransferase subunit B